MIQNWIESRFSWGLWLQRLFYSFTQDSLSMEPLTAAVNESDVTCCKVSESCEAWLAEEIWDYLRVFRLSLWIPLMSLLSLLQQLKQCVSLSLGSNKQTDNGGKRINRLDAEPNFPDEFDLEDEITSTQHYITQRPHTLMPQEVKRSSNQMSTITSI